MVNTETLTCHWLKSNHSQIRGTDMLNSLDANQFPKLCSDVPMRMGMTDADYAM